jgi:hypothetical protein
MSNPSITTIWAQRWLTVNELYLEGDWFIEWKKFTDSLQRDRIRPCPIEDELIWGRNVVRGNYSTKLGYIALFGPRTNDEVWWWKKI